MLGPQLPLDASQNGAIDRERMSTEAAATEAQPRREEPRSPPGDTLASQDDQNNVASRRASASSSRAQSNMSSSTDFKLPPRVKTAPKTEGKKKEIYRVFDAVPFTPSQGVRTPSPNNMAALRWRHISPFANPHYMRTDSPKSVLRRPPTSDTSSGSESSAAHPHSPAHPAHGMPAYSPFMMYPMGPPIPGYMAAEMHPGSPHHPHSPLIPGSPVATPPGAMFHSSPFAPIMPGSPVMAGGPYHSPFGMGMHMGGMPMQPPPPPPPAQHGSNTSPQGNNTHGAAAGGMQRAHTSPPPPPPPMGQQQQQQAAAGGAGAAGPSQLASPVNMPNPASAMAVHQQPGAGPRMVSPFYPTSMGYSSGYPQGVPFMQPPMAYPHMPSPLGLDASGAALRRQLSTPLPVPGQVPMMASPLPGHMAAAVSPQHHSAIRLSQSAEFGELAGLKLLHHQQAQQQLLQRGTRFAGKSRKNAEPKIGPDGNPRLNARQRRTLRRAKERALKGLLEVSQVLLQRADIPIPTITAALERDLAMASDCDSDDDDADCASPTALSRAGSMSLSPPGMGGMGQELPGPVLSRTHSTSLTCAEPLQECSKPCSPVPQTPAARDSANPSQQQQEQQQQQQDAGVVGSSDEPVSGDSPEMSENGAGDEDADADGDGEAHGGSALASFDMAGLIAQLTLSKEEGLIDDKLIRDLQIIQSLIGALKTPGSAGSQQQASPQQQPTPATAATPTPPVQQQQQQPSMSPAALHLQQQQQQQQALLKAQLQHQQHQHMQQQLQQQQLQQMQQMQQMQLAAGLTTSPVPNVPLPGMYGALSPAGMMGPMHPSMHGLHAGLPGMMPGAGMPVNAMRRPDPRVRRTFSFAAGC